jgi:hypothetical protein
MKNSCKSLLYTITIAIWYYVLSFVIKILYDLFKATKECVELLMFTIAIFIIRNNLQW